MTDLIHKQSHSDVKLSGLDSGLDLDADKVAIVNPKSQFQRQIEAEELKKKLQNQPFDPLNMEFNIQDPMEVGGVSFNPNNMSFDF